MRSFYTFLLALFVLPLCAQQSQNMTLLGQWHDPDLEFIRVRYNDVWGYAAGGREYALLGSRRYTIILDVTDPANVTEVTRLDGNGSARVWRDIKTYANYAYFVTEHGSRGGLSGIDLSGLPAPPAINFSDNTHFNTSHNLLIDSTSSPARLYALGVETGRPGRAGYVAYSLADPANPVHLASVSLPGGYVHDAYARGDTLYANHGNSGLYVYDVSDINNPVELARLTSYTERGYNHSGWLTEDGTTLVFCDENFDTGVKIANVENLPDINVQSVFRSSLIDGDDGSIAHNPYVLGNDRVVLSYYDEGLQIWDFSDPTQPFRLAYYDTTPNQTSYGSDGVWGAYPYLPSGNILASDQETGLHILRLDAATLPVTYTSLGLRADKQDAVLEWTTGTEEDHAGWTVQRSPDGRAFTNLGRVSPHLSARYAYRDEQPGMGTFFYRLRQEDLDGTVALSELLSVEFGAAAGCYPNPARPGAEVVWRTENEGATQVQWELMDALGRPRARGTGNFVSLPGDLLPGLYTVRRPDSGESVTLVVN